MLICFL